MTAFLLGLTGSIGMGKSTTAGIFEQHGLPVWSADAAVHRLYARGGAAVAPLAVLFPDALQDQAISRDVLRQHIGRDPTTLARLETVVHPLVATDRAQFVAAAQADIVVLDIPLLFENGTQTQFDATLLVTAPAALQRSRVLARPGMTEDHLQILLSRQMPDAHKRGLATHIVETLDLPSTAAYVSALISHIRARHA
jgi:dephospho-CoA kinase